MAGASPAVPFLMLLWNSVCRFEKLFTVEHVDHPGPVQHGAHEVSDVEAIHLVGARQWVPINVPDPPIRCLVASSIDRRLRAASSSNGAATKSDRNCFDLLYEPLGAHPRQLFKNRAVSPDPCLSSVAADSLVRFDDDTLSVRSGSPRRVSCIAHPTLHAFVVASLYRRHLW